MKELSEYLKSERMKQGLSLKQVSERAHLSVSMLKSLEDQDYERIGTPLLIRSFVKAYCRALELDPAPLLEQYQKEILTFDRQDEGIKQYGIWSRAMRQGGRRGIYVTLILILAGVVAAYGGSWLMKAKDRLPGASGLARGIYQQQELPVDLGEAKSGGGSKAQPREGSDSSGQASHSGAGPSDVGQLKLDAPPVVGQPGEMQADKPGGELASQGDILAEDKPRPESSELRKHRFEVEASQKTWIQVKVDGKKSPSIMLQPGEKREWEADDNVQVVVGNGGGVNFKWDGQTFGSPGKPGRILRMRFPLAESSRRPAPGQ